MKLQYVIWALSAAATILTNECRADLNGSDDFNDNSKDTNRWGADFVLSGAGVLTETNQHLEYTTSGTPTSSDIITRPWILNFGSYTQSWEVQIDLNVPAFTFTNSNQQVFVGLVAFAGSLNNRLLVEFGQGGSTEFRSFYATNGVHLPNVDAPTATTSGAVRLAFDANSKVLSSFYDDNGADCGYSWTLLRAEEIGTDWALNDASAISIAIIGDSSLTTLVSSNDVFADNFRCSSGDTPRPRVTRDSGSVVIIWQTNAPVVHLESADSLTAPVCWQPDTNVPAIVNTNFVVTNITSSVSRFYRLSR